MKHARTSLKTTLSVGLSLILVIVTAALFVLFKHQNDQSAIDAAQKRQMTSLRVLVDKFQTLYPEIEAQYDSNGNISEVTWNTLPEIQGHELIDQVGRVSGETATLFGWDSTERDFIRLTTNIKKPDGSRAVGTWLGKQNPVHASMLNRDTYLGQANILGKSYFTVYQPVLSSAGDPVGIFYVGVSSSEVESQATSNLRSALLLKVVLLGAGLAAVFFLVNWALKPLSAISGRMAAMSQGDLETEVPHTGRGDVLGTTARALEDFRNKLKNAEKTELEIAERQAQQTNVVQTLSDHLARLSEGNLTVQISSPFPDDYEQLRKDFNASIENLDKTIGDVINAAESIRNGAGEVSQSSEDLSKRTESQAATLEETAAALDELTASVKSAAEGARSVEATMSEAKAEAEESGQVVQSAVDAMTEIEQSSTHISQIISVIDDIAFQTNLLALNAGVEAARAGEAGRGFAVVASEVRALAQRSSEAALEIKTLINDSSKHVKSGVVLVGKTGEALKSIVDRVAHISSLVSNIAEGAAEQSIGLGEINVGVNELDRVTQKNAAMVEEATAVGHMLRTDATKLSDLVTSFSISGGRTFQPTATPKPSAHGAEWSNANVFEPRPSASAAAGNAAIDIWQDF